MAGQDLQGLHRTGLGDDGVQTHRSGNACLARQRRIHGLNFVDQRRRGDIPALLNTRDVGFRRGWRSTHTANHAADDAAHRAARDATRPTTGPTLVYAWSDFLNELA